MHLFEFNDQPWFPRVLRDGETAYLATAYRLVPLPRHWAEKIVAALQPGDRMEILDLCSGAGGPVPALIDELERLGCKAWVTLTDLYPNPKAAAHPRMAWCPKTVDATRVPPALTGTRTMFTAFHHFRPEAARAILEDAFRRRRSICIFEERFRRAAWRCDDAPRTFECACDDAIRPAFPLDESSIHLFNTAAAVDLVLGWRCIDAADVFAGTNAGADARSASP